MGLALAILGQASALDALDAWERRLFEAEAFEVTVRHEEPGREVSMLRLLYAADGRFRIERSDPENGHRTAVCDGHLILCSPRGEPFLLKDPAIDGGRALLSELVRVGLPEQGALLDELSIRELDATRYRLDGGGEPLEVEFDIDSATGLPRSRRVRAGRKERTETFEWNFSPSIPPGAFDLPWDFGLPEPVERHAWVPVVEERPLTLAEASLLRAGAEIVELWDVPVVVCPTVARRRGSVSVSGTSPIDAAAAVARAWGVAMRAGSGAIEFVEGEPPAALAIGQAGPFGFRVTAVERTWSVDLRTGQRRPYLQLMLEEDRVPGAASVQSYVWCRPARDDRGREIAFVDAARGPSWAVMFELPAPDARWITLEGTLSVEVPEGFERVRWESLDEAREWEVAEGRLLVRFDPAAPMGEGMPRRSTLTLRPGEGLAIGPRAVRAVAPREWWPQGSRRGSGEWSFSLLDLEQGTWEPAREVDVLWGARRVDLPLRIEEVPLP